MSTLRCKLRKLKQGTAKVAKEVVGRLVVAFNIHRRMLQGKVLVVAFHSITREKSHGALRCSVKDFDAYCRFFAQHMNTESLTATVQRLEGTVPLNGELSITFDDGYADNVELALPILKKWSLPATFYVTTGFIETQTQTPWDRKVDIRSRWMTWSQVRQLIDAGHDVGAHTVSHINLAEADASTAESELRASRDAIIEHTKIVPRHFAVPYGRSFSSFEEKVEIARALGFRSMSLCRGGLASRRGDTMHIERWPINPLAYLSPYGWIVDVIREVAPKDSPGS